MSRSSRRRLNDKQLHAIEYLSTPNRAGLTYKEIAHEVGVNESTIHRWRQDDVFYNAVNDAIVRKTQDRLADMFDAAIDGVIDDKNAALFRTIVQAHGLLTEKVEVSGEGKGADVEDIKAEIERMRRGSSQDDE